MPRVATLDTVTLEIIGAPEIPRVATLPTVTLDIVGAPGAPRVARLDTVTLDVTAPTEMPWYIWGGLGLATVVGLAMVLKKEPKKK